MNHFGTLLRTYIKRSGYSNYGIAKKTGINRTTLQKVLTGERSPSARLVECLLPCLQLTAEENDELLSLFETYRSGDDIHLARHAIRRMLESVSEAVYSKKAFGTAMGQVPSDRPGLSFHDSQLFHGAHTVERLLNSLIQEECFYVSPAIHINVPGNSSLLHQILMHTLQYCVNCSHLKISHLTCFVKPGPKHPDGHTNLEILSNLLPFVALSGFQYDIYYYYEDMLMEDSHRTAFPYYIIFQDTVVFLSADCATALPSRDPSILYHFDNLFEAALMDTVPLITDCPKAEGLLPHLIQMDENDSPLYSLEYQPCLPTYLTDEIICRCTRPELSGYDNILESLTQRVSQLSSLTSHTCIFSKTGLLEFTRNGRIADFPQSCAMPLVPSDRRILMESLYQEISSDRQQHRMVNPLMFPISDYLSCVLHKDRGLDFSGFASEEANYNYIHLTEKTLLDAFLDFFHYLHSSSLVYSREDTLAFIRQCIDSLT